MSASYTLRGFAQDARGAINDVLDSFTLPVFGGFMLGRYHSGPYPAMGQYHRQGEQGTRKEDSSHWLVCRLCIAGRSRGVRRKECHFRYQPVDMRYRIRKGLESPCMIRGLLPGTTGYSSAVVPPLSSCSPRHPCGDIRGNWNLPVLVLVISLPTCRCFYTS